MKINHCFFLICILCILTLTGCAPKENGDNISAFCYRMNSYNESYNLTPDGYIFDDIEESYTRFFILSDGTDLMLQFKTDERNRIYQMNVALTPQKNISDSEAYRFITDCISAFCNNEDISTELVEKIDLRSVLTVVNVKTKSAEIGKISIKTDTTEIGTIISLYNNNYT